MNPYYRLFGDYSPGIPWDYFTRRPRRGKHRGRNPGAFGGKRR